MEELGDQCNIVSNPSFIHAHKPSFAGGIRKKYVKTTFHWSPSSSMGFSFEYFRLSFVEDNELKKLNKLTTCYDIIPLRNGL
jgi:hypothetical protein